LQLSSSAGHVERSALHASASATESGRLYFSELRRAAWSGVARFCFSELAP